ncbi:MAG TPA: AI-2E family transporter, partial [Candidatus Aphodoplasma excrementigallinarum]|nr:AI-2E family transporter [Candidatus Aphodoplasma excrementigallinarum]
LNMNATMSFLGWVFAILNPFIIGLVIAFVINIIMTKLEANIFKFLDKPKFKLWHKMKRGVCLTLSFLLIILVITALLFFIGPQLADSVRTLSNNIPSYISYLQELTNDVLAYFDLSADELGIFAIDWRDAFNKAADFLASVSPGVITFASGFTSAVFNFFMGLIFAVYLLTGKEKLILNFKRLLYAYLPESKVNTFLSVGDMTNSIFTGFVVGQLTEAVILGTMYFIGTSIFRMPYAPLISVLMAVCSLIPMFGPIIGAVPSAFILLMVNPNLAIIFVVMAVVFQQIEGNFIYPRVVGSSVGLPGIWVLFAILVGGSLLGGFGMILAVPVASVLYALLKKSVGDRLRGKNMRIE